MAEKSVAGLPEAYKSSLHYRQICREGVQSNFRMIAAFDRPMERGYLNLLEGIFIILFKTYNYPSYYSNWAPPSSYDLVKEIRTSLDVSNVSWMGKNASWPVFQGFYNNGVYSSSPCCNPTCKQMTFPIAETKRIKRRSRSLADPGNPLGGGYLCGICGRYSEFHRGELPSGKLIETRVKYREAREAAGGDATCHSCGRLESQFHAKRVGHVRRKSIHDRKFRLHSLVPNALFCTSCHDHNDREGKLRTEEEVEIFLGIIHLANTRAMGVEIACENCNVVEGSRTSDTNVYFHKETKKVLCKPCENHWDKHRENRDPDLSRARGVQAQMRNDRKAGNPVICTSCGKHEDLVTSAWDKFHTSHDNSGNPGIFCKACKRRISYLTRNSRILDPELRAIEDGKIQLRDDRRAGKPITCMNCTKQEGSEGKKSNFSFSQNLSGIVGILCQGCKRRFSEARTEAQKAHS